MMESHARLLNRLLAPPGSESEVARRFDEPRAGGPTLVLVDDPRGDAIDVVHAALDALDADHVGGRLLVRRRQEQRRQLLTRSQDGTPLVNGRACCYRLSVDLNQRLGEIRPGDLFRCRICRSVWRVDNLVREERRHA